MGFRPLSSSVPGRRGGQCPRIRRADPPGGNFATWCVVEGTGSPSQSRLCRASTSRYDCPRQSWPSRIASLLPEGEPLEHHRYRAGPMAERLLTSRSRIVRPHCGSSGSGKQRYALHRARIGCGHCPLPIFLEAECTNSALQIRREKKTQSEKKMRKEYS